MPDASARTRREWRLRMSGLALLAVVLLLAVLVALWDWNWFKGPIERRVSAATGREFVIAGDLDVDLGSIIVARAGKLSLANAAWSQQPEMAGVDELRIEIPFWPLVKGERTLRRIDIVRPRLRLERNAGGDANWRFGTTRTTATEPGKAWSIGELRVHDGYVAVRDIPLDTDLRMGIDSEEPRGDAKSVRLLVDGEGRYRGSPFALEGIVDSPVALLEKTDAAYRIDMHARAGETRARAHGTLHVPLDPTHFQVDTELSGEDLADLYPLVGLAVPSTPPYRVTGRVERDGSVLRMHELKGRVGDSDVAGTASVDLSGERPYLAADIASSRLDIDDLAGLLGLPPSVKTGETFSTRQRVEARKRAAGSKLLPDTDYDLRKLNSMNADVHLHADSIDAGKWPVERIALRLKLRNGVLQVSPLDVGFAGGRVRGGVRLDARNPPIDASADVEVRGVDLARLLPSMQPPNLGRISGRIDLTGQGNSIAAMLGSADGEVQVGMGRGRFSNLLLELAGLDVAETLKFLLADDKTVPLRCAYADFELQDGVAKARSLVFDTTDTVLFGEGKVNFRDESLAMELRPEPKDVSPISLRGPLEIGGTFKDPDVLPKPKQLLARVAAAAALYAIAPPAALLALIETGPGEDTNCRGTAPIEKGKPRVKRGEKRILEASRDDAKARGG